ncbi:hypothetical protein PIB30_012191 [Stylosanthes scabra]|uniref:F-box domain-containing protein n=1 Tax=Stylosanthes scabra TaxID=79078 RepID=A0ABU6U7Q8_9FABA|nr:hypothetical protein [Stylosanthes scabra]
MDRLSALPKPILHAILARLPDKDAAKTIALSKTWRDTWFSFPNLSVCIHPLRKDNRFRKMDILIDYRLCECLTTILIGGWIQMASESGIEVLELHLPACGAEILTSLHYNLPFCVTEAKSLTKLVLGLGIRVDQEFLSHSMKFSSLKRLSLCYVRLAHEGILQNLISHCPLIEYLLVKNCYVPNDLSTEDPLVIRIDMVKSLFLNGLQKLKEVHVQGIQEVHIDSPNLENLSYCPMGVDAPFKLNFDSCTKLRCCA